MPEGVHHGRDGNEEGGDQERAQSAPDTERNQQRANDDHRTAGENAQLRQRNPALTCVGGRALVTEHMRDEAGIEEHDRDEDSAGEENPVHLKAPWERWKVTATSVF